MKVFLGIKYRFEIAISDHALLNVGATYNTTLNDIVHRLSMQSNNVIQPAYFCFFSDVFAPSFSCWDASGAFSCSET